MARIALPSWMTEPMWLDDDNALRYYEVEGVRCGAIWYHRKQDKPEDICFGSFKWLNPLPAMASQATWDLISAEPLHIEPSLHCLVCGAHGFIRDGKWVAV